MPDARTTKVVDHLKDLNSVFAHVISEAGPIPATGAVDNLVARYGIYGYRQVEAITTLAESSDVMHMQIAQQVRSLVEAWFYAAWIAAPPTEELKLRRAIGLVTQAIRAHRDKLDYQSQHFPATDPAHVALLEQREQEVEEQANQHGRDFPPDLRQGMETLGRPDRYITYRWDSDAVHVSTTGLGQLALTIGNATYLGVAGDPDQELSRLVTAWMSAADLYELVATAFGLDLPDWDVKRSEVEQELATLFEEE